MKSSMIMSVSVLGVAFGAFAQNVVTSAVPVAVSMQVPPVPPALSALPVATVSNAVTTVGVEVLESRMFDLTYANAGEVAENLNRTWRGWRGPGWGICDVAVPFVDANAVMVTAPKRILDACSAMLEKADRKPRQVYIEARFIELENQALFNLGIDWQVLNGLEGTASFSAGISQQNIPDNISKYSQTITAGGNTKASQTYEFVKGGIADNSYFQGTLSFSQMKLVLSAFQASEDVRTFSNPKVIVASGRKAVVDMTTKRPNVVMSSKRVTKGGDNTLDIDMKLMEIPGQDKLMFAKETFFSWGISLEVTPRVMTNGLINIRIVPSLSTQTGSVKPVTASEDYATVDYPIIDMQRIVTEFNMKSGMTAVIGGLSRTEEGDYDSGIPWLCEIPWIGEYLFGGKRRTKVQKDVLVFVTVGECQPEEMKADAGLPKNAVLGRGYINGARQEPGDRTNAVEGVRSLDLRSLEERAAETSVKPL